MGRRGGLSPRQTELIVGIVTIVIAMSLAILILSLL